MGTVGYMAPEQVRGQAADHRADIFAFGAILYEMLTGTRTFRKPTSAETMTAILNEDPPSISQVLPKVPPGMQRVVHRCLEKNPEQRFHSAHDLAFALDALSDSGAASSASAANIVTSAGRRWKIIVPAVVAVLALSVGGYFVVFHHKAQLTDKDTIVLADFANSTGDPIFDDTLKTALTVALQQSPFLSVLPDSTVAKTLQLMTRPASAKLTPDVTRELCQRAGSKAYIGGAIGSLGNEYVVGLKVVNCQSGDTLAQEQVTVASKEKVLEALGETVSKPRTELGESLATVQKFDVPLAEATTSSLEALKAYGLGEKASNAEWHSRSPALRSTCRRADPVLPRGTASRRRLLQLGQPGRASEYSPKHSNCGNMQASGKSWTSPPPTIGLQLGNWIKRLRRIRRRLRAIHGYSERMSTWRPCTANRGIMRELRRSRGKPCPSHRIGSGSSVRQPRHLHASLAAFRRNAADHPRGTGPKTG